MFNARSPKSSAAHRSPTQRYAATGARGQGMTEFVFILVGIGVACMLVCTIFGCTLIENFETANAQLEDVDPTGL